MKGGMHSCAEKPERHLPTLLKCGFPGFGQNNLSGIYDLRLTIYALWERIERDSIPRARNSKIESYSPPTR